MSDKLERLKGLLRELFQLDQPDLDFGIYRIMHAKSAEVTQFLDNELLPQVRAAFEQYQPASKAEIRDELDQAIEQARGLGVDPESTQKVQDLRRKLADDAVDLDALEAEVYDHLYHFFRRYYSEGDFLAKRVYKPGVYAIPYEGEEVKLHWANKDQYYIKTDEYLRDYAFKLRPHDEQNPMRVHFRLVDATEGEHGNVKATNERRFVLAPGGESGRGFIAIENGDLIIHFQYRLATLSDWPEDRRAEEEAKSKPKAPAQADLTGFAAERVLGLGDETLGPWIAELQRPHVKADGTQADYSRLVGHLNRYTARNTFDYFIHKDLGGFLRRELDFFIKNEIMHLDDVESETAPRVEQYLSKIRVVRRIAHKIIDFLAQLEDFQKKLWLKKKFVTETSWCVSIATIHTVADVAVRERLLADVVASDAQRQEWIQLHAINEIEGDLAGRVAYSEPLTTEFLRCYPTLMIDTSNFDVDFAARLLEAIGGMEQQTDGVLIHSENFQALSLLQSRYRERVQCIYIDPPYNTGNDGFPYKDRYQHSSWLTMMEQSLARARALLGVGSAFFASSDDNEAARLRDRLDSAFGPNNLESQVVVQSNKRGQTYKSVAKTHEYLFAYDVDDSTTLNGLPKEVEDGEEDDFGRYELWELRNRNPKFGRFNRPNLFFPIYVSQSEFERVGFSTVSVVPTEEHTIGVHPRNSAGEDSCWRWSTPKVQAASEAGGRVLIGKQTRSGEWRIWEKSRKSVKAPKSIWLDNAVINEKGTVELGALGFTEFGYPKPLGLLATVVQIGTSEADLVVDYFAGTGTTGHAVIEQNRQDGGERTFVLVEVGGHFNNVLTPRLKKVAFSPEWKEGKPSRLASAEEMERSPRVFKILRLESYEDALNNLEMRRRNEQQSLLMGPEASGPEGLRERYMLRYMLDVETRGSPSLLNVGAFIDPTAYKLKVKRPGSDESREVNVDLLETFNWLIGLTVQHIAAPQTLSAEFERDAEGRLQIRGRLRPADDGPWWFRTVTGTTPDGKRTLVIWRKRPGGDSPEGLEQDNLVLNEWFSKSGYSTKDYEFDLIYVNGDNNLENLKTPEDTWKVRLIEEDFHRLMFDVEDV